jgi:hypothetical protein
MRSQAGSTRSASYSKSCYSSSNPIHRSNNPKLHFLSPKKKTPPRRLRGGSGGSCAAATTHLLLSPSPLRRRMMPHYKVCAGGRRRRDPAAFSQKIQGPSSMVLSRRGSDLAARRLAVAAVATAWCLAMWSRSSNRDATPPLPSVRPRLLRAVDLAARRRFGFPALALAGRRPLAARPRVRS